jgi:PAS domain S-box-containing protein
VGTQGAEETGMRVRYADRGVDIPDVTAVPEGAGEVSGPGPDDDTPAGAPTPKGLPAAWRLLDLQSTIENLSAAVVVSGLDGTLWYANREAEKAFGWVGDRLIGKRVDELGGVEVPAATAAEIRGALQSGKSWSGEFDLNRPDGSVVTVAVSDSGLYDANGALVGVVSIVTDVTEVRRSVRQLVSETEALRFLLDAATLVSSALGFDECMHSLASLAVPLLADLCLIDVLVEGSVQRAVSIHADPDKAGLAERLFEHPPKLTGAHPAAEILRSGAAAKVGDTDDDFLRGTTGDEEHYRLVKELGFTSYMCAPLKARGRVLGTVTLVSAGSGRRFMPDDLALVEALAGRVAHVVDNARLYSEQARVARSLQAALLPRALPAIPGLQLAAAYQAAGEGNEVGGDFYDVFESGRGTWAVVIGDVCGRGPDAAAVTGLVRHALHASGRHNRNPRGMLQFANSMLCEDEDRSVERFCTAAAAMVRPGHPTRVAYASAGHPPAVVRRSDGNVEELSATGITLGVVEALGGKTQRLVLDDGDLMVMYTDGLTEARDAAGSFYGEHRLMNLIRSAGTVTASELVDTLVADLRGFTGGSLGDDLGLVVFGPEPS